MKKAWKRALLGVVSAIAVGCALDVAAASSAEPRSKGVRASETLRCLTTWQNTFTDLHLGPGGEVEIGRWESKCRNAVTRTFVTDGLGLRPTLQRLENESWKPEKNKIWKVVETGMDLKATLDLGVTYRLMVKNKSASEVHYSVHHSHGTP